MKIKRVVIHRIGKQVGTQAEAVPVPKNDTAVLQNKTEFLLQFVENIRSVFNSSGTSVFGQFHPDSIEFPFSRYLQDFLDNSSDSMFLDFCQHSTLRLYNKIKNIFPAKVDFAIYIQYQEKNEDFLFIVILNNVDSALVGEDGQLTSAPTLDIHKLHHAGRINISQWISGTVQEEGQQENPPRNYLSFISKRESGISGSGYFREFIGGSEYTDADKITRNLKSTIKAFAVEKSLDANIVSHDAFEYLFQHINEEISIRDFANRVFPELVEDFLLFSHEKGVPGEFKPSRREVKRFQKLSLRTKDYSISFDRDSYGDTVLWDKNNPYLLSIRVAMSDIDKIRAFLSENDNTTAGA